MCNSLGLTYIFLQREPGFGWLLMFRTFFHHGVGAIVVLLGICTDKPWVWRHGVLIGIDVADWISLFWNQFFRPGPLWVSAAYATDVEYKMRVFNLALVFFVHHGAGIAFGVPCCLYLSHIPEVQWFGS